MRRSHTEPPTGSDDDDPMEGLGEKAAPPKKKLKPFLEETLGARTFLNATLAHDSDSTIALRYPTSARPSVCWRRGRPLREQRPNCNGSSTLADEETSARR